VATAAGVAVLTQGLPYLLTGTDPASWAMVKLEAPQACVARRSIVDMGDYGMYASPDGLVAIQGAGVEVVTTPILTREQWQAYNPATIIAAQSEGRYVATYVPPAGGSRKGFIYDPITQSFTDLSLSSVALYTDLLTDTLLALNPDGAVVEWNRDTTGYKPYRWMSKLFYMPRATNFAAYQVVLADYDAQATTLQIYVTDARLPLFKDGLGAPAPAAITDPEPKRLPGGFLAREYMIELVGTGHMQAVGMASTIDELKEQP